MKKLISIFLFLIYFLTSIVYISLYEFKNVRNILWKDDNVSCFRIYNVKKINTPKQLIEIFESLSKKHNLNIYNVSYKSKSGNGKRTIRVYSTCNGNMFNKLKLSNGRLLRNEDFYNKFISSEDLKDENQLGKFEFFSLDSILNIYNLSGILYNGELISKWFVDTNNQTKIKLLEKDLKNELGCEEVIFYVPSSNEIDMLQSDECYRLKNNIIGILIIIYVITFLTMIYWLFSIYKELAIKKMFGESNVSLKIKIIFKKLLKYHIYGCGLSGFMIFSFLIYKLGLKNLSIFFKNWLLFNFKLTLISILLMAIPLMFIKYVKIPLMLKNKKPVKVIQNINNISKCFISVAMVTAIINSSNSLYLLIGKMEGNKIWDNALNYTLVKRSGLFEGTVAGRDNDEKVENLDLNMKKWFKICNKKGEIYINARNHRAGIDEYEKQQKLRGNIKKNKIDEILGKSIKVNNNYLQLNPIYGINGKQINIPDHDEHTLNLLVPERLKLYEKQIQEKYKGEFYSNNWPDYKLNIIYIKDGQKCFTYQTDLATETQNYVIGSIIQVISNNNMCIDSYGCCDCNGFYPKISNIDNPYQDVISDIKDCNIDNLLISAKTLYETAAQKIYEIKQEFIYTIEYAIFSVILLLMLIISSCINYLEQNKVKNTVKKLNGVGFAKRSIGFFGSLLLIWLISICLMLLINYNGELVDKVICLFYIPSKIVLIDKLVPSSNFYIESVNWKILLGIVLGDVVISAVLLKIYENKKISSVLKGE